MTSNAVIDGLYSDFKFVKTRGVAQVVIEIPLERAQRFVEMFGVPNPAEEAWVAVAKLVRPEKAPEEKPRQRFEDMSRAQQAGILCGDDHFLQYIGVTDTDQAVNWIYSRLSVESRRELDSKAPQEWDTLVADYRIWERYGDMRP